MVNVTRDNDYGEEKQKISECTRTGREYRIEFVK